jgi:amino acid transporter
MDSSKGRGQIGVFGAAFMGIGAMVGAGIFALLGEAGAIAGTAVWLSFLIAGAIAMLQGYSFAKLGTRYPSRGGTIEYLTQGFGDGHLTGSVSWLFYLVGQIITVMVALSFGSYAGALFFGDDVSQGATKLLALFIVVVMAVLNLEAKRASVARVQTYIVWAVIAILGGFSYITLRNADYSLLSPDDYPGVAAIISSVALTFFAFLGFAVIAFAVEDMENPQRDLPRAMYFALVITTALYVAIAIGVYGMLPLDEVIAAGNTAIAAAAEPILGTAGFVIMTIAACFSTSSAVNSQFFATGGVVSYLARIRQMPAVMGHQAGENGNVGTVVSMIIVSVLALLFDLSAIASIGSAVALLIFMMVGIAHVRLARETGAKLPIIYLSIISVVITLAVFAVETLSEEPATALALIAFIALSVLADRVWRHIPFLKDDETAVQTASDASSANGH